MTAVATKGGAFGIACLATCLLLLFHVPAAHCASLEALIKIGQKLNSDGPSGTTITEVVGYFAQIRFTLDGNKTPGYLYPGDSEPTDRELITTVADLILEGQAVANTVQDWYCFTGAIRIGGKLLPSSRPKYGNPEWRTAVLIGGQGKFYQGKSLFFPEVSLTSEELNTILSRFRFLFPKSRNRKIQNGITVTESVSRHPYLTSQILERKVALFSQKSGPDAFECVFVFQSDLREKEAKP